MSLISAVLNQLNLGYKQFQHELGKRLPENLQIKIGEDSYQFSLWPQDLLALFLSGIQRKEKVRVLDSDTSRKVNQVPARPHIVLPPLTRKKTLNQHEFVQQIKSGKKDFSYEVFDRIDARGFSLIGINLEETLIVGSYFDRKNLEDIIRGKSRLRVDGYHDLRGIILDRADLKGLDLSKTDLTGASLVGADVRGANMEDAILTNAHLSGSKWDAQPLSQIKKGKTRANSEGKTDFVGINLANGDLIDEDLSLLDLRKSRLDRICLKGAQLSGTRLGLGEIWHIHQTKSRLGENGLHDFEGVDIQGESLIGTAYLHELNLKNANLYGVRISAREIKIIVDGQSRLNEDGMHDFTGVNLLTQDLQNLDLSQIKLTKANLKGAKIGRNGLIALIKNGSRLGEDGYHDFNEVNLDGIDLRGIDLTRVRLNNASMKNAMLDRDGVIAIIQFRTRLTPKGYVDLRDLDLTDVDLVGINFEKVYLRGTKISSGKMDVDQIVRHILSLTQGLSQDKQLQAGKIWHNFGNLMDHLTLDEATQLYGLYSDPTMSVAQNSYRMIQLGIKISQLMDRVKFGEFRRAIHARQFEEHQIIITYYLNLAIQGKDARGGQLTEDEKKEAIALLNEAKRVDILVYEGNKSQRQSRDLVYELASMGLLESTHVTSNFNIDNLVKYAIAIRERAHKESSILLPARLAVILDRTAFGICAFKSNSEINTKIQAQKMGALILTLYGCGYGDKAWLEIGQKFIRLSQEWDLRSDSENAADLHRYGVLALRIVEEVENSYYNMYHDIVYEKASEWGLDDEKKKDFARNIYRIGAVFQLAMHVNSLGIETGNYQTVNRVMRILSRDSFEKEIPYQAFFYAPDEASDEIGDSRVLGGKGRGLRLLALQAASMKYEVPMGFTLPPLLLGSERLNEEHIRVITQALKKLEKKLIEAGLDRGRRFSDGTLKVSVRSGAAVSMPGMMDTELNINSIEEIIPAVERVYQSWDNAQSRAYRNLNGIPDDWGTAVNIVVMVDGEKDANSGAGVVISKSTDGISRSIEYTYGRQVTGEELVSGRHKGDASLAPGIEEQLKNIVKFWEEKLRCPVEIEFTVESGKLHLLQIRQAHLNLEEEIQFYHALIHDGKIDSWETVKRLGGQRRLRMARTTVKLELTGHEKAIVKAKPGSGNPYSGRVALTENDIQENKRKGEQSIYVTSNSDAAASAHNALLAGAVISGGGNPLSHLAVDAKAQGLAYLSGLDLVLTADGKAYRANGGFLRQGDWITMDPNSGSIYAGVMKVREAPSRVNGSIDRIVSGQRALKRAYGRRVWQSNKNFRTLTRAFG